MNLTRVLFSCGSLASKASTISRNSSLVARHLISRQSNNSVVPRRLLMSSIESGGIRPYKARTPIPLNVRLPAAFGFLSSLVFLGVSIVKEDEINKFLGTDWNTTLLGLFGQFVFGLPMAYLVLASTFPF